MISPSLFEGFDAGDGPTNNSRPTGGTATLNI
jgi:hypothetical protein